MASSLVGLLPPMLASLCGFDPRYITLIIVKFRHILDVYCTNCLILLIIIMVLEHVSWQDPANVSLHIALLKHFNLISCEFTHSASRTVEFDMLSTLWDISVYTDRKVYIQMITVSAGTMYDAAHNGIRSLTTSEKYQNSLNIQSRHSLSLNICCKSFEVLSISKKNNHVLHYYISTFLYSWISSHLLPLTIPLLSNLNALYTTFIFVLFLYYHTKCSYLTHPSLYKCHGYIHGIKQMY